MSTPILTISILCSGRSDTTIKCLDSLTPIREAIPTELIITDTGCDSSLRAKIEEYADKILDFKWCDDFAAARNVGLNAATGKWFLYVDDDEYFIDVKPLIEFLLNSQSNQIDFVDFTVRNYYDELLQTYGDAIVSRLSRMRPGIKFNGLIHEYVSPLSDNRITIDCMLGHTGYINQSADSREAKAKRNIPLIKKMIKKEPDEARWAIQLAQEYECIHQYKLMYDLAYDYYRRTLHFSTPAVYPIRCVFSEAVALALIGLEKWYDLKTYCNDMLENMEGTNFWHKTLMLYGAALGSYLFSDREEASLMTAAKFAADFMENKNALDDNRVIYAPIDRSIFVSDVFDGKHVSDMLAILTINDLQNHKIEALDKNIYDLGIGHYDIYQFNGLLDSIAQAMLTMPWNESFEKALRVIVRNKTSRATFEEILAVQAPQLDSACNNYAALTQKLEQYKNDIILTISILCSGREKTTEKCLASLAPIRDAINCELIITDTGCDSQMRSVVEKYADKILDFTWCNDFAAARNVGLNAASGQWFMFVDDDEYFVDCQELIDFFSSGKYQNYDGAEYTIRNFKDIAGKTYSDSRGGRMRMIKPETRFEGLVHETIRPEVLNVCFINSLAEHYGYAFISEEEAIKHTQRNLPLLEKQVALTPHDDHWTWQLAMEYVASREYDKAITFSRKQMTFAISQKRWYTAALFATEIVNAYAIKEDWSGLLNEFPDTSFLPETDLWFEALYAQRACLAHFYLFGQTSNELHVEPAIDLAFRYLSIKQTIENDFEKYANLDQTQKRRSILKDGAPKEMYSVLIAFGLYCGDTAALDAYFPYLEWDSTNVFLMDGLMSFLVDGMVRLPWISTFDIVLSQIKSNINLSIMFQSTLQEYREAGIDITKIENAL